MSIPVVYVQKRGVDCLELVKTEPTGITYRVPDTQTSLEAVDVKAFDANGQLIPHPQAVLGVDEEGSVLIHIPWPVKASQNVLDEFHNGEEYHYLTKLRVKVEGLWTDLSLYAYYTPKYDQHGHSWVNILPDREIALIMLPPSMQGKKLSHADLQAITMEITMKATMDTVYTDRTASDQTRGLLRAVRLLYGFDGILQIMRNENLKAEEIRPAIHPNLALEVAIEKDMPMVFHLERDDTAEKLTGLVIDTEPDGQRVELGKGGFGVVYSAHRKGVPFVLKLTKTASVLEREAEMKKKNPTMDLLDAHKRAVEGAKSDFEDMRKELRIQFFLGLLNRRIDATPNFVECYDFFATKTIGAQRLYSVLERMDGNVWKFYTQTRFRPADPLEFRYVQRSLFLQLMIGLYYAQKYFFFVHMDTRPPNVLFQKWTKPKKRFVYRNTDPAPSGKIGFHYEVDLNRTYRFALNDFGISSATPDLLYGGKQPTKGVAICYDEENYYYENRQGNFWFNQIHDLRTFSIIVLRDHYHPLVVASVERGSPLTTAETDQIRKDLQTKKDPFDACLPLEQQLADPDLIRMLLAVIAGTNPMFYNAKWIASVDHHNQLIHPLYYIGYFMEDTVGPYTIQRLLTEDPFGVFQDFKPREDSTTANSYVFDDKEANFSEFMLKQKEYQ